MRRRALVVAVGFTTVALAACREKSAAERARDLQEANAEVAGAQRDADEAAKELEGATQEYKDAAAKVERAKREAAEQRRELTEQLRTDSAAARVPPTASRP